MTGWLQIQALRPSDEGTYRCLARNALGQVEASATLTVLTPGKGALSSELWTPGGWGVLGPLNSWKEQSACECCAQREKPSHTDVSASPGSLLIFLICLQTS